MSFDYFHPSNQRFFNLRIWVSFSPLDQLLSRLFCLSPFSSVTTYNVTTQCNYTTPNINNTVFCRVWNAMYVTVVSVVTRRCRLFGCPVVARPTNHYYLLASTPSINHRVYYADVLRCTSKICIPLPTARTTSSTRDGGCDNVHGCGPRGSLHWW